MGTGNHLLITLFQLSVRFYCLAVVFLYVFAGNAISKGNQRNLKIGLTTTIIMGAAFLVGLGIEYYGAIFDHNFTPSSSLQGSCFYALTGLHASHVIVGLIFLFVVLMRSRAWRLHSEEPLGNRSWRDVLALR